MPQLKLLWSVDWSVDALSTEVKVNAKPAYAESMSDTKELSHWDLEDIVVNLRKQSEDDDQGFMVDEHNAMASISDESVYESDKTDQVLAIVVDEHIVAMADPYWRGDYEFNDSHDDEDSRVVAICNGRYCLRY